MGLIFIGNIMKHIKFEEVHKEVIAAKIDRQPIKDTLKKLKISKTTYYRCLGMSEEETWVKINRGKIAVEISKNSQKVGES